MRKYPDGGAQSGPVHYEWGAAKAWSKRGHAMLFCGVPGTGKTMSAEVLSNELDLPLYKIDLSQVVNKYVGETEKNLMRHCHRNPLATETWLL